MSTNWRSVRTPLVALLAVSLICGGLALAKKPVKPPPEPPPAGTILFNYDGEMWGMNGDGSDKFWVDLPDGEPSNLLYGTGYRWRLSVEPSDEEPVPGIAFTPSELFAFRPDGGGGVVSVQLTDLYPDVFVGLYTMQKASWSNDGLDSFVSFRGSEFDWSDPDNRAFKANHIYRLNVSAFEIDDGSVSLPIGLDSTKLESVVSTTSGERYENYEYHHWSPDGTKIVYSLDADPGPGYDSAVWVTDLSTNETLPLWNRLDDWNEHNHRWSPDGTKIAIWGYGGPSPGKTIWTVNPDGSDPQTLATDFYPWRIWVYWSPDSQYLVFGDPTVKGFTSYYSVNRMKADGTGVIKLTGDLDSRTVMRTVGWVSNDGF